MLSESKYIKYFTHKNYYFTTNFAYLEPNIFLCYCVLGENRLALRIFTQEPKPISEPNKYSEAIPTLSEGLNCIYFSGIEIAATVEGQR